MKLCKVVDPRDDSKILGWMVTDESGKILSGPKLLSEAEATARKKEFENKPKTGRPRL